MVKLPSGWIFIPRFKDASHIELEERKLITCQECKWSTFEGEMLICTLADTPHSYDWYCAGAEEKKREVSIDEESARPMA